MKMCLCKIFRRNHRQIVVVFGLVSFFTVSILVRVTDLTSRPITKKSEPDKNWFRTLESATTRVLHLSNRYEDMGRYFQYVSVTTQLSGKQDDTELCYRDEDD